MSAVFIRLLAEEDKGTALQHAVQGLRAGDPDNGLVYRVEPAAFGEIPGSPFAYWASERVRQLFRELPPFESEERTVRVGLQTSDDFRFVRAWWEVPPEKVITGAPETTRAEFRQQTFEGKKWVPFAKGGGYSPYYADLHLVVNWERDGEEIRNFIDPATGRAYSRPQNTDFYFRPGLTWSRRTQGGFSMRALPGGVIFADKGPVCFAQPRDLSAFLGLMNSIPYKGLLALRMCFGSYEVGVIKLTPVPSSVQTDGWKVLSGATRQILAFRLKESAADEVSHTFASPFPLSIPAGSIQLAAASPQLPGMAVEEIRAHHESIDGASLTAYDLSHSDQGAIAVSVMESSQQREAADIDLSPEDEEVDEEESQPHRPGDLAKAVLSYALGCAFGRWDVRFATGEREGPPLPDPFAPLPACSPGMLTGEGGLPAPEPPVAYPLTIARDRILVDDPDHTDDVVTRARAVLDLVWGEQASAIEREACELLGVKDLREYFRNPRLFFDDHINRYSRSRRKAPLYWLLQSSKRSYGLWLYLHRLDADTLFKALDRYVGPKLSLETQRANDLRAAIASMPQGANRRQRERDLERQEALVSEITDFKSELERVARLGLAPDLDDGVVLTIAPLHKLVPWKEAERYWKELMAGKYPWASIAKQLRAKGLVR